MVIGSLSEFSPGAMATEPGNIIGRLLPGAGTNSMFELDRFKSPLSECR